MIKVTDVFRLEGASEDHLGEPLCSKQDQLLQFVQGCIWLSFEYLPVWRLHSLPGKSVPVFNHPVNKVSSLVFKCRFLYLSLCSLPLVCSGSVWVRLLYCPHQFLYMLIMFLWAFSFWAGQSQFSQHLLMSDAL